MKFLGRGVRFMRGACALFSLGLLIAASSASAAPVTGRGTWETTLHGRDVDGNAVALNDSKAAFFYDSVLDVTWLANMNVMGRMKWSDAVTWADNLAIGGFNDWRLPAIVDSGAPGCDFREAGGTDCGFNPETQVGDLYNELAHLYFVTLGNLSSCTPGLPVCGLQPQPGYGLVNTAYFVNMSDDTYWYGDEFVSPSGLPEAWGFVNRSGFQFLFGVDRPEVAAAVRDGDVLRQEVPEPPTASLLLAAVAALSKLCRGRTSRRLSDVFGRGLQEKVYPSDGRA